MAETQDSNEGIRIPPGYQSLESVSMDEIHSMAEDVRNHIRWLGHSQPFLFDPENPEYVRFLHQCKEDTRELRAALQKEFDRRGVKVWASNSKRPKQKSDYQRVSFLIRPPFFHSNEEKTDETRMSSREDEIPIMIHVDQDHCFQRARVWVKGEPRHRILFGLSMTNHIAHTASFFEENYGKWDVIAHNIVTAVIDNLYLLTLEEGN